MNSSLLVRPMIRQFVDLMCRWLLLISIINVPSKGSVQSINLFLVFCRFLFPRFVFDITPRWAFSFLTRCAVECTFEVFFFSSLLLFLFWPCTRCFSVNTMYISSLLYFVSEFSLIICFGFIIGYACLWNTCFFRSFFRYAIMVPHRQLVHVVDRSIFFCFCIFFLQKLIFTPNYFHFSLPLAGCDWKCICRALVQFRSVVRDSFPCTICRRLLILDNYTNHLAHTNGTVLSTQCKVHPPVSSIITLISREQPLRRGSINFVAGIWPFWPYR